jgi:hypothetical protein
MISTASASGGIRPVRVIDLFHQVAYKLSEYHQSQRSLDFIDLIFLMTKYRNPVCDFRESFNTNHRRFFVERFIQQYPCFDQRIRDLRLTMGIPDDATKFVLTDGDVGPCGYLLKKDAAGD